jgi:hypothetical protein
MTEPVGKSSEAGASTPAEDAARARKHRLLEIRETQTRALAPLPAPAVPPVAAAGQGEELNNFIKQLVDRRSQRRHQLEIIQDFFENPVEFGIEADVIPSGTPLEEIRERKKELRYRIDLLRSVLEALEGEHKLLTHAEMSALKPHSDPVE